MATPANSANRVEVGHTLDKPHSVWLCGTERAHQDNAQSWRSPWTNRRFFRQVWEDWMAILAFYVRNNETNFEWVHWHWSSLSQLNLEHLGLTASLVAKCQLISRRLVSKKPCTWFFVWYYTTVQWFKGHFKWTNDVTHCEIILLRKCSLPNLVPCRTVKIPNP